MTTPKPLAGVRVLELARILAGPWAGQLLADLGAEVIKVERPEVGDDTRGWGPPFVTAADGSAWGAAYFHACNRGKKSVAVDFETADGQGVVRALAAECDVIIENFKVGGLVKYGLDMATLRTLHPRLVTCSITGFGADGPYANRAGYDFMIQGMAGLMDITGDPAGEPQKVGVAVADIFTGIYATVGILAALRRRDTTGEGGHVDMALLDSAVGILANQAMNYLVSGRAPTRLGNAHPNIVPYQVFAVADGHVIVAVGNDGQHARFCQVIGAEHLAGGPYAQNRDRVRLRDELVPLLSPFVAGFGRDDLLARLEAAGVPAGPINTIADVFDDPQVVHRGLRLDLRAADGSRVPGVASPIVIDGVRQVADGPSPRLGADTAAVLQAFNISLPLAESET
ncbi:CaiB/BaiF CoA transferase family protein [Chthonobacter rhizosphaerae]|uniref:CaiB/BaiF CoA transferase family protein n=1 Tax=Chthonobacter rhizosphaerae TaxID=2735553 RepID=UPI0015EE9A7D|nr:CaiB/BaiF CoA-transferase family protein [Chthonobacter rhizosphaerae]